MLLAVPLVGSAAGDELELTAAARAAVGGEARGRAAELLDGVDGRIACDGSEVAGGEIVDIQAIDGGVALVNPGPGGRTVQGDARVAAVNEHAGEVRSYTGKSCSFETWKLLPMLASVVLSVTPCAVAVTCTCVLPGEAWHSRCWSWRR